MLMSAESATSPRNERERISNAYTRRLGNRTVSFYDPTNVFFAQEMERDFIKLLREYGLVPLEDKRLLDVGTAGGYFLRSLLKYGVSPANLFGVDIWEGRLIDGHRRLPALTLLCADGRALPFPSESFDIVVQTTMLSSVLDRGIRRQIGNEIIRVLKKSGMAFSFDFRFKRPGDCDVCAITLRELEDTFAGCNVAVRTCCAPPKLIGLLAPRSQMWCEIACGLWPLKTHYWATVKKP